jgi:hypothetical protein
MAAEGKGKNLPILPNGPGRVDVFDLAGLESFILAVVPLSHFFG